MIRHIARCAAGIAIILLISMNTFPAMARPIPTGGLAEAAKAALGPKYRPLQIPNTQQAKLLANDKASDDHFGSALALSVDGNTALIGARDEDDSGSTNSGAVYVFIRTGASWAQQAKLLASDKATDDGFGVAVALSEDGNTALIGASGEDDGGQVNNGAAYVFIRTGTAWTQQAKLFSSDKLTNNNFGVSTALSRDGNTALISAPGQSEGFLSANGAAYVFTRSGTTWTQQTKLLASDKASNDAFGRSVSLSGNGNTALIGAIFRTEGSIVESGAAYVFIRTGTTWTPQSKLLAIDAAASNRFGGSVALSWDGNTAIVGAFGTSDAGLNNNGSAYMFTRSGTAWVQQAKLFANDKASVDYFGYSVGISGDGNTPVIGAWAEDDSGTSENGAAYVFTYTGSTWTQQAKLLASDKATADYLGAWATISGDGNTVLAGAYYHDDSGTTDNGAAYIFVNPPPPPQTDTIGIYRPSNQTFYLRNTLSSGSPDLTIQFGYLCNGAVCNYPIVGDWNGDGIDTIGLYDQVQGVFQLRDQNTPGAPFYFAVLGNPNDQPLAGRWTADMTHDGIGVFRASNGILYLKKDVSTGFSDYFAVMGNPGDVGLAGDWNGDGLDSVGVYRPALSRFYLTNNNQPSGITFSNLDFLYGDGAQDKPFVGDWTGNKFSDPGVFRNGIVMLRSTVSGGPPEITLYYGAAGDMPLAGKWIAPVRPPLSNVIIGVQQPSDHVNSSVTD